MRHFNLASLVLLAITVAGNSQVALASSDSLFKILSQPIPELVLNTINGQIQGQIRSSQLEFSPPSTIVLHQLELLDQDGVSIIHVNKVTAKLSLLSLFVGKIKASSIKADNPTVKLSTQSGYLNIEQVFKSSSNEPTTGSSSPFIELANISVRNGYFEWLGENKQRIQSQNVSGLANITISSKGFQISSSTLSIEKSAAVLSGIELDHNLLHARNSSYVDGILSVDYVKTHVIGAEVRAAGTINFSRSTLSVKAHINAPAATWPKGLQKLPFQLPNVVADVSLKGALQNPTIQAKSQFGSIELYKLAIKRGQLDFEIGNNQVKVSQGSILLDDSALIRPQGIFDITSRRAQISAKFDRLTWPTLQKALDIDDVKLAATLSGQGQVSGFFLNDNAIDITATAEVKDLKAYGVSVPTSTLELALNLIPEKSVQFTKATLSANNIHADVKGSLDIRSNNTNLFFSVSSGTPHLVYTGLPKLFSANGFKAQGKITGSSSNLRVNAKMNLGLMRFDTTQGKDFSATLSVTPKQVKIDLLKGTLADGAILGILEISREKTPAPLSGSLTLDGASLGQAPLPIHLRSRTRGRVNAQFTLKGTAQSPEFEGQSHMVNVHFDPLFFHQIDVQLSYARHQLRMNKLVAQMPYGEIHSSLITADFLEKKLFGSLSIEKLKIESIPELEPYGLAGGALGSLQLTGNFSDPQIRGTFQIDHLSWDNKILGSGKIFAWYLGKQKLLQFSGELSDETSTVEYRSTIGLEKQDLHAEIRLRDVNLLPWTSLKKSPTFPMHGDVSGQITVSGSLSLPDVWVDMKIPNVEFEETVENEEGHARLEKKRISMGPLSLKADLLRGHLQGSLCGFPIDQDALPCSDTSRLQIKALGSLRSIDNYDVQVSSFIKLDSLENWIRFIGKEFTSVDASLAANARFKKKPNQELSFEGLCDIDRLRFVLPGVLPISLLTPTRVHFHNNGIRLANEAVFSLTAGQLRTKGSITRSQVNVDLDGTIPLIFAKFFVPHIISAQGAAIGELKVRGTPKVLQLNGKITPEEGSSIRPRALLDDITFWGGSFLFSSTRVPNALSITADHLDVGIGDGRAKLNGDLHLVTSLKPSDIRFADWNLHLEGDEILLRLDKNWIETDFDLYLQTIAQRDFLRGQINVSDGQFFKKFEFQNFILSSQATRPPTLPTWLWPMDLNIDISVRSFHVEAQMSAFLLDSYLRADLNFVGTPASPKLIGAMEITEGTLKFPQLTFDIATTSIPFKNTPGRFIDPQIEIFAHAELPRQRFGLSEDTSVELSLIGNLDRLKFDIRTLSGDKSLDRTRLLLALLGSTKAGVEVIEEMLSSYTGTRLLIGSAIQQEGITTQVQWQLSPRLELEGSTAATAKDVNFQDLKLKFMIFDHLPFGKQLFLEGMFFSPVTEGSDITMGENIRLKFRAIEQ